MRYRAALIGCGNIGSLYANDPKIQGIYTHAGAYIACPKTELVSVCDIDEAKAKACAEQWKIDNYYTDIEKLLHEQQPQIVSICTVNKTHADILSILLKTAGIKGIIVEKPLALDVKQAYQLVQLAKEKEIPVIVNYNRRYAKGHQKIKQQIENGEIGRIQKISGYYTKGILHNGTHWIDLARWLVGEIESVQGFCTEQEIKSDPPIDAYFKFKNGASAFLQNLDADAYSVFEMDILGTEGRIRITYSGHRIEFFNVDESPYYDGYQILQKQHQFDDSVSNVILYVVEDLISCIENGVVPRSSGDDGLAVLQIADALIQSARVGK